MIEDGPRTFTGVTRFLNRVYMRYLEVTGQVTFASDVNIEGDLTVDGSTGLGTSSPDYKLEIIGDNNDVCQVHIGDDDDDTGMYLVSTQYGDAIVAAGVAYDGTAAGSGFVAKTAEASFSKMDNGNTEFYGNTGLTPGVEYTPNQVAAFNHGGVVINESGFDHDYRIESDNEANMLFVDGGTDQVAIGTATPDNQESLTISNDAQKAGVGTYDTSWLSEYTGVSIGASAADAAVLYLLALRGGDDVHNNITTNSRWDPLTGQIVWKHRDTAKHVLHYEQKVTPAFGIHTFYWSDNTALTLYSLLDLSNTETVFNRGGKDIDFRIETDDEEGFFLIDGAANTLRIGDGDTNYTQFVVDGELTLVGTARVTKSIWLNAGGIKSPGGNPATFVEYGLTGVWQFADQGVEGNQESVSGTLKIPNEMDVAVAPTFHVGWSADGSSPGNCEWQLEYLWLSPNEATDGAAQETLTIAPAASSTADGFVFSTITGIDLPSATDKAMLWKITRLSAGGNDTIADTVEMRGCALTYTCNN